MECTSTGHSGYLITAAEAVSLYNARSWNEIRKRVELINDIGLPNLRW